MCGKIKRIINILFKAIKTISKKIYLLLKNLVSHLLLGERNVRRFLEGSKVYLETVAFVLFSFMTLCISKVANDISREQNEMVRMQIEREYSPHFVLYEQDNDYIAYDLIKDYYKYDNYSFFDIMQNLDLFSDFDEYIFYDTKLYEAIGMAYSPSAVMKIEDLAGIAKEKQVQEMSGKFSEKEEENKNTHRKMLNKRFRNKILKQEVRWKIENEGWEVNYEIWPWIDFEIETENKVVHLRLSHTIKESIDLSEGEKLISAISEELIWDISESLKSSLESILGEPVWANWNYFVKIRYYDSEGKRQEQLYQIVNKSLKRCDEELQNSYFSQIRCGLEQIFENETLLEIAKYIEEV